MHVAVIDLGFGDAGKGILNHCLASQMPRGTMTVRFNGGAQAGHTVIDTLGRRHVFSQFGASTLVPHTRTLYSRHCVFHPTALLKEVDALVRIGVTSVFDKLLVSEACLVTTPYHQAINRIREKTRGIGRHGSCGVGFGETLRMRESLGSAVGNIIAGHLSDGPLLRRSLKVQKEYCASLFSRRDDPQDIDAHMLFDETWWDHWIHAVGQVSRSNCVRSEESICQVVRSAPALLFEGAQGVLLDEHVGFAPYTTPSTCTLKNVHSLLNDWGKAPQLEVWGMTRTHMVRHGEGPLPTENLNLQNVVLDETNFDNPWQGKPRYGAIDFVLLKYAIRAVPEIKQIALSHLDTWERIENGLICVAYNNLDLEQRLLTHAETLYPVDPITPMLATERPKLEPCEDIVESVQKHLGLPIKAFGMGPRCDQWRFEP